MSPPSTRKSPPCSFLSQTVTDCHSPSQPLSQPRRGACSLLTPEGGTGERKANKRDPLGPRSSPKTGRSSKNRSRGGMPPVLPPLSAPFSPERGRPGRFQARAHAPFFLRSPCRLFCYEEQCVYFLPRGGRIRMLLDKNPRVDFLSPHAPAGAARLQADFPGFTARLRRSSEEEDRCPARSRPPSALPRAPCPAARGRVGGAYDILSSRPALIC